MIFKIGFFSFGYFGGHDYKDDIKKTCGDYKQMISNAFTITEKNMKENLEDVKNDKIELINLIFKTAASNFEELKKNMNLVKEIVNNIYNLLKNNNLLE